MVINSLLISFVSVAFDANQVIKRWVANNNFSIFFLGNKGVDNYYLPLPFQWRFDTRSGIGNGRRLWSTNIKAAENFHDNVSVTSRLLAKACVPSLCFLLSYFVFELSENFHLVMLGTPFSYLNKKLYWNFDKIFLIYFKLGLFFKLANNLP